jgi:YVTN family beta-propeller protein
LRGRPRRLVLAVAITLGCGEAKAPAGVQDMVVTPLTFSLARHDTLRLRTTIVNEVGDTLTGIAVTFHSNNTALVTVDGFGLVQSVGPLGSTSIAVTAAGLQKTAAVTVFGVPGVFTLTPTDTFMFQGGAVQLTATLLDTGGVVIPGATVTYTATGPVSVNASALVTSLGAAGEASVSASFPPYFVTARIHVLDTALAGRVTAVGHPAAVAVSRTGTALVTRELAVFLTRINLPSISAAAQIRVPRGLSAVAFDTTGNHAYALDPTGKVHVIDLASDLDADSFPTRGVPTADLVTHDNLQLLVATDADSVVRYDRVSLAEIGAFAVPAVVSTIVRHPLNPALLYLALPDSGLVLEYDVAGDSLRRRLALGGAPARLAVAPDGSELYAADRTAASVHVWDLVANTDLATIPVGVPPADIDVSPSGTRIWISARTAGQVKEIDQATRAIIRTVTTSGAPRGLAVSRLDGKAVVANDSGWVDVIKP